MTTFLTDPAPKTLDLIQQILEVIVPGDRCQFLVEAGSGKDMEQRLRVMLSRLRKKLEAQGKRTRKFKLNCSVFPWTDRQGKRWDSLVMWTSKSETHELLEILEDKYNEFS